MQIKFLGAAGTVTGSCYLLTSDSGESILIDCGMFQGNEDLEKLNYLSLDCDCSKISGMVLTHAHLDHCGRLPTLVPQGFSQTIWMTPPTRDLTELSLYDSAKVGKSDTDKKPLYDKNQVAEVVDLFKTVSYEKKFFIGTFGITLRDAGHILGSASVEIIDESAKGKTKKVVFSGDLGNSPQDLIKATELIGFADAVVMESTYGDSTHPTDNPSDLIEKEIETIETSSGTLLIPAFSIERSQELLHRISHLKKLGKVKSDTRIFFDSPMAEKATVVFEKYRQFYNNELKHDFANGDPFNFSGLIVIRKPEESKAIKELVGPKVIIAGSGMMTGGRILNHALHYLPIDSTRLLIVGYQGEGTLGRLILEGQKKVIIEGKTIDVRANISQTQAMSSHADQPRLLDWLKQIKGVKKTFLTHGENIPRGVLAEKIKSDLGMSTISLPNLNESASLDN